jgi:hypothetical protein
MKTLKLALGMAVVSLVGIGIVAARPPLAPAVLGKDTKKPVFVTGSLIPQRVDVKAIGTDTVSPVRVIKRAEIDRTGKFTSQGILLQDPAIRISGLGGGMGGSH